MTQFQVTHEVSGREPVVIASAFNFEFENCDMKIQPGGDLVDDSTVELAQFGAIQKYYISGDHAGRSRGRLGALS